MVAQPLARLTQEHITTTPAVQGVYLSGISRKEQGGLVLHRLTVGRG